MSNLGRKIRSQRKALRIITASMSIVLRINGQSMSNRFLVWEEKGRNPGFLVVNLPASRFGSQRKLPQ